MTKQSKAQRLADALESGYCPVKSEQEMRKAAAELRRLHTSEFTARAAATAHDEKLERLQAINTQLLEALTEMVEMMDSGDEHGAGSPWHTKARAAIAIAKEE